MHSGISLGVIWLLKSHITERNRTNIWSECGVTSGWWNQPLHVFEQYTLGIISAVLKWQVYLQEAGRTSYTLKNPNTHNPPCSLLWLQECSARSILVLARCTATIRQLVFSRPIKRWVTEVTEKRDLEPNLDHGNRVHVVVIIGLWPLNHNQRNGRGGGNHVET